MRILWILSALLLMYGCSDNADNTGDAPLHHYKEAIDNTKMVKQLQEDANLQRMPQDTD